MEYIVLFLQTIIGLLIISILMFMLKELMVLIFGMNNINILEHAKNANLNNALHNEELNPTLDYTYGIASCQIKKNLFKDIFSKKIKVFELSSQSRPHGQNAWS